MTNAAMAGREMMADEDGATPEDLQAELEAAQRSIAKLEAIAKKERKAAREAHKLAKAYDGLDPDEAREAIANAEKAAELKAEAEGNWAELREKLEAKHERDKQAWDKERAELTSDLFSLYVSDGLEKAISDVGFLDANRESVRAIMLLKNPRVEKVNGKLQAVIADDMGDDVPLADYVKQWSETDAAAIHMPGTGASGSGEQQSKGNRREKGVKMIPNDPVAIGRYAEQIAKGEVRVQLDDFSKVE